MPSKSQSSVREAVGVFQSEADLQAAIDDLLTHGFDRSEISLLASQDAVEAKLDHTFERVSELEDDPGVPTIAYTSKETIGDAEGVVIGGLLYVGAVAGIVAVVASGGAVASILAAGAIGGGAGAAVGSILANIIGRRHADHINDQLERGGLLLWVRTWNAGDEARATKILSVHSGADVHVHGLPDHAEPALEDRFLGAVSDAERKAYGDETLVASADGACYAYGKVFSNPDEAKAYLDRRAYIASLHDGAKAQSFDLQAALADPASMFEVPSHLMATHLPDMIKTDLLRRWAYDEKAKEKASDDGMPEPHGGDRLQEIEKALRTLHGRSAA